MSSKSTVGIKRLAQAERDVAALEKELAKDNESIDPGIRDSLVVFNAFGLYTSSSCEGHFDKNSGIGPYIDVIPLPEKRWWSLRQQEGQARIKYRAYADKHSKPADTYTKREKTFLDRLWKEMHKLDKPMGRFTYRLITLLGRFYENRTVPADARLILWDPLGRFIMLISQGGEGCPQPFRQRAQRAARTLPERNLRLYKLRAQACLAGQNNQRYLLLNLQNRSNIVQYTEPSRETQAFL